MIFTNNHKEDYKNILASIDAFQEAMQITNKIEINRDKLWHIVHIVYRDFPCVDGIENASTFKKAAYFICFFISEKVILNTFQQGDFKQEILNINNHQNAILGLFIVSKALHGAYIKSKKISNPIKLSVHSYIDIIESLSSITPVTSFHLVTVLLEQLIYKQNPDLQNSDTFELG